MTIKVIRIPSGKQVSLGNYASAWKTLLTMPLREEVTGWEMFPTEVWRVLAELNRGMQDRINKRGGLNIREPRQGQILKLMRKHLRSECKWCGSQLDRYEPRYRRFCDDYCQRSYR